MTGRGQPQVEGAGRVAVAPVLDPARGLAVLRGVLARPLASYYLLLSSAGLLLLIGLAMVLSATSVRSYADDGNAFSLIAKQATYAVVGLLAFWACQRLPVRTYRALGTPLLIGAFLLLAVLDVLSLLHAAGVTKAPRLGPVFADNLWLHLGPLQAQPSELAKFALVLWGAEVLVRKGSTIIWWRELASPLFVVVGLLFVLVGYTDLGTMLCLVILFLGLLWAAGVRLRVFSGMVVAALVGIALLIKAPGKGGYRVGRLDAFLNPASESCQQVYCYQAMQGRYAIADGGWFGVGLGKGSLKWGWLPNGHNDFIFALIGEELGVVGCLVVLALFGVLTYTGLRIARRVSDPFRRLAAAAVTAWLVGQAIINIGGVVGLLPITGLPLPFISDGGSALVVTFAAVGMLASFARAEPDAARALHARPPARWVRLLWAPLPPLPAAQAARRGAARSAAGPVARSGAGSAARSGVGPAAARAPDRARMDGTKGRV